MDRNIVIVVSAMNMGGAQTVVSILSNYWSKNGYRITLISTFSGERTNHYKLSKNVVLKYLSDNPFSVKSKLLNLFWKFFHLRRLIKSLNPDLVISFLTRVNVASVLATIGIKSRIIICERTWPPFLTLNDNLYWMYRLLFKVVDRIIVQTDKSKIWLGENFPDSNVAVIPNPIIYPLPSNNLQFIPPNGVISRDRKVILASGRLHRFKQFDMLINAYDRIKDKYLDWDLIILGEGEERDALSRLIFRLGLSDRIYCPGSVGNISEWYERADLFVLSSILEGFPNVLLEAMAHGLPSISFDCDTGPRDMIQDGVNGVLVNPREKELGLQNAMEKMISDDKYRHTIASNSILSRDKYAVGNVMKEWDRILDI